MTDAERVLEREVELFQVWAGSILPSERGGEWECGYNDWQAIYRAFAAFVTSTTCKQWSEATIKMLLYIIARDNEMQVLAKEVATNADNLMCLAQRVVDSTEQDAKWQLAVELGRLTPSPPQVESLVLQFANDEDEYVRRRALLVLADIHSPNAVRIAEESWQTGDEHQRMAALYVLYKVESPLLDSYLAMAEVDGRGHLVQYATAIRSGRLDSI